MIHVLRRGRKREGVLSYECCLRDFFYFIHINSIVIVTNYQQQTTDCGVVDLVSIHRNCSLVSFLA